MTTDVPTLYDWVGGAEALNRLTGIFYDKVLADPLLEPIFRHMSGDHPAHVAAFIGEVFGGPAIYSDKLGGHAAMIRHHLGRHLTEDQRRQWIALLLDAADEVGLPDDPEFRSALVAYLEWGTRLARLNSQDGADPELNEPMPKWGWGVPGGPYQPPSKK
ncbi:globin [Mesorhizobium sp. Root554]|uniref:group II truncated hemoglobin n=1 Tax=unclassified Mesorhizobium TaxID=325217 RepID=UPI0006F4918E|nr:MULTISPECIES: group II truncated hemoglobin [unclassified Mesorhizobium]KQZ12323.1 globin [Mesorhizobium sp. Root1471]KQZ34222.1 globin [Mesorhizobium sp. Root554]